MGKRVVWNESMLGYIREHYANEPACDIAEVLGISDKTVSVKAREMGLKKSPDFDKHSYCGRYTHKYGYKNNRLI